MSPSINSSKIFKTAPSFYFGFEMKMVKRRFVISNVSAGTILPARYGLSGPGLRYTAPHLSYNFCLKSARLKYMNHMTARIAQVATGLWKSQAMAEKKYVSSSKPPDFRAHLATYLTGAGHDFARVKCLVCGNTLSQASLGMLGFVPPLSTRWWSIRHRENFTALCLYHSPASSADIKNRWSYTPLPQITCGLNRDVVLSCVYIMILLSILLK
jgi:hypothetical protein